MHHTIETARLMLRPPREGDLVSLSQSINSHAIVRNTARIPWPYTLDDAHAYLRVGGYRTPSPHSSSATPDRITSA